MSSPARHARSLAEQLVEVVEDTIADLDNMPFFVRPMVKRGYKKRTGRTLDEWLSSARRLVTSLADEGATRATVERADRSLLGDLAALQENYRTAPLRAQRGMQKVAPATVRMLEQQMARREQTVAELHQALHELPPG